MRSFVRVYLCGLACLFVGPVHAQLTPLIQRSGPSVVVQKVVPTAFPSFPTDLVEVPDGSDRLMVATVNGSIYAVDKYGGTSASLYLDTTNPRTGFLGGHIGSTSIAFHPGFAIPESQGFGRFYTIDSERINLPAADFVTNSGVFTHHNVLMEWTADNIASPTFSGTSREIMRVRQPTSTHNMNDLAFDNDGNLYVSLGDSNFGTLAPDLTSAFGKILRIDPLGNNSANGKYGIPTGNPFTNTPSALPEVFASGFRNPYRISIDRDTGALYTGDVGENSIEEINLVSPGGNYGWPQKEGSFVAVPGDEPVPDVPGLDGLTLTQRFGLIDPITDYDHANGTSVAGGFVYRGTMIPWLQNDYVFSDLANLRGGVLVADLDGDDVMAPGAHQQIYAANLDLSRSENYQFRNVGWTISVGEDNSGEMYFLTEQFLLRLLAGNDLSGDGQVDGLDLSLLYSNWNQEGIGDLSGDGLVDGADFALMTSGWTGDASPVSPIPEPVTPAGFLLLSVLLQNRRQPNRC